MAPLLFSKVIVLLADKAVHLILSREPWTGMEGGGWLFGWLDGRFGVNGGVLSAAEFNSPARLLLSKRIQSAHAVRNSTCEAYREAAEKPSPFVTLKGLMALLAKLCSPLHKQNRQAGRQAGWQAVVPEQRRKESRRQGSTSTPHPSPIIFNCAQ